MVCKNLGGLRVVWGRLCKNAGAGYCVPVMAGGWSAMVVAKIMCKAIALQVARCRENTYGCPYH